MPRKFNQVTATHIQPAQLVTRIFTAIKYLNFLSIESKDHTLTASKFDISTLKGVEEDFGRSQMSDFDEFQTRSPFKSPTSSIEKSQGSKR